MTDQMKDVRLTLTAEQALALAATASTNGWGSVSTRLTDVATALEDKIPEPYLLGSIVWAVGHVRGGPYRPTKPRLWVRAYGPRAPAPWYCSDLLAVSCWYELSQVREAYPVSSTRVDAGVPCLECRAPYVSCLNRNVPCCSRCAADHVDAHSAERVL